MGGLTLEGLLELEHRGWEALSSSRGGAFYGRLMTPDGVMVLVDGSVLDREAVVASLDGAPPWGSYALTEPRIVPLGAAAAALVYRARAERAGAAPFVALMASTYRLLDGEPRLALYQQTTATH